MAQTYYRRPYSLSLLFIVVAALTILFLITFFVFGRSQPAVWVILSLDILVCILGTLFDPGTAIKSERKLDDGTVVPVRRPLVGFRHCETRVGLTGGYEVRVDGWRYEEAIIRI